MSAEAVRELHVQGAVNDYGHGVRISYCQHDGFAWPCPTMQALDGLRMDVREMPEPVDELYRAEQ